MNKIAPISPQPRLKALNGIKVLAVAGIIIGHMGYYGSWDICARMVEILFILSGFCMAYNHYQTNQEEAQNGWQIIKKKLPKFYPIHITTFLLQLFFVPTWANKSLEFILIFGTLNLSLQQAWFQKTQFMFNNVSWFLSSLIFCYFITPSLKKLCKSFTEKGKLWLVFLSVIMIRTYLEYAVNQYPRELSLDLHTNPLIQGLNYTLGYIAGIYYSKDSLINKILREQSSQFQISLIEILCLGVYISSCYSIGTDGYRIFYVILGLPIIYILGFGKGYISRLLSIKPFSLLEKITLEVFMLHSFILYHYPAIKGDIAYDIKFTAITLGSAISFKILWKEVYRIASKFRQEQE